jgi:hypothetical protein
MAHTFNRRAFMTSLTTLAAARPLAAQDKAARWEFGWLDAVKAKHRQVFDLGAFELGDESPLRLPNNYMNTLREAFPDDETIVAVGLAGSAFPVNASDALWQKYTLGERWKVKDPDTGKPATRNIYLGEASGRPAGTVRSLAARGAIFWQCNIALGGVASRLANETGGSADAVRAELVAGLNPGVKIVPAHSMAVGLAQEHGFTYMKG